jgi:hypothetical protein
MPSIVIFSNHRAPRQQLTSAMDALIDAVIVAAGSALFAAFVCFVIRTGRGEEWNCREVALCRSEHARIPSRRVMSS